MTKPMNLLEKPNASMTFIMTHLLFSGLSVHSHQFWFLYLGFMKSYCVELIKYENAHCNLLVKILVKIFKSLFNTNKGLHYLKNNGSLDIFSIKLMILFLIKSGNFFILSDVSNKHWVK